MVSRHSRYESLLHRGADQVSQLPLFRERICVEGVGGTVLDRFAGTQWALVRFDGEWELGKLTGTEILVDMNDDDVAAE